MMLEPIYSNGEFVRYRDAGDCPDVDSHTECPDGGKEYDDWEVKMSETHTQKQCPSCGLWMIWEKKRCYTCRLSEDCYTRITRGFPPNYKCWEGNDE